MITTKNISFPTGYSSVKIFIAGLFCGIFLSGLFYSARILIKNGFPFQASVLNILPAATDEVSEEKGAPEEGSLAENEEEAAVTTEDQGSPVENSELDKIQNDIDEITEMIDVLNSQITSLNKENDDEEAIKEEDKKKKNEEEVGQEVGHISCELISSAIPLKNKVIINEIAWMGSSSSANNEWIELKNISGSSIDLHSWQILDKEKQIKIFFEGENIIPAGSFYLLERTDDNSVPFISADLIYSGALSDTDEALFLFNENCQLEDEALANPNWLSGSKTEKRTMERTSGFSWQTFYGVSQNNILGTPKRENSIRPPGQESSTTGQGGGLPPQPEPSLPPKICSQENLSEPKLEPVIFNEIAWMGTSNSWQDEWIELKNISENEISLSGWQILDKTEEIKLILSGTVLPNGFYILERTDDNALPNIAADKIFTGNLNDNDETLWLFDKDCNLIDEIIANPNWPAGSKEERITMERKEDLSWQSYFGVGENNILGTPKEENSILPEPEEPKDETSPTVSFDSDFLLKTTPEFEISWKAEDPPDTATPSGVGAFYLRYTANPPDNEGIQYEDADSNLQEWSEGEILEISDNQNNIKILGKESTLYNFKIKAKDKAGNESEFSETTVEINSLPVVINEIAWMGTENSPNDEWIELFNNTNSEINLSGWKIIAADGSPAIGLTGKILAKDFYLLERTDDNTLPDILSDQIYTGPLGNSGEKLALYGLDNILIDSVICIEDIEGNCTGWLAGDNATKQTLERKNPQLPGMNLDNWNTSQGAGGTPKAQNSQFGL